MSGADRPVGEIVRDIRLGRRTDDNFRQLFLRHHEQVCRFFQRKGLPEEDARDLAQDVFFSVYRGLMHLREETNFTAWLFTIARNAYVNYVEKRRAQKREGEVASPDVESVPAPVRGGTVLDEMLDQERLARLRRALEELPGQMRRCVQLRVAEECSYEEIAAVMGISVNTVKAHLFQAKASLRDKLSQEFQDG